MTASPSTLHQIQLMDPGMSLAQHWLGEVDADEARRTCIIRQRYTSTNTHLKNAAAGSVPPQRSRRTGHA